MVLVVLKDVWKSYNGNYVLRGINLVVNEGDVVGIVGRSGSGKTTLVKLVGLLERADRGELVVLGRDSKVLTDSEASSLRLKELGIIPQTFNLIPHLTVLENITLPLYLLGVRKSVRESIALELLKRFNLQHLTSKYPHELSSGEQQRVLVIRAFINKPKLVLADEPTAYLDVENSELVYSMFKEFISEFKTSIIITATNPNDILINCSKYLLSNGVLTSI
jgi:ABC-type lipoprotein export system ATPase subunit